MESADKDVDTPKDDLSKAEVESEETYIMPCSENFFKKFGKNYKGDLKNKKIRTEDSVDRLLAVHPLLDDC